jgi:hypothetical protein
MSEHLLPDDLGRWPENPYDLLGVSSDVDPRELRRAYTRLIRHYKPEQFPEHFQRIRSAYEMILRYAQFFGATQRTEERPPAEQPEGEVADRAEGLPMPRPILRTLAQDMADAWELVCRGEEASAYRRLLELHERHPQSDEVFTRLYWLLALTPEVDPGRSPCEWLVRGLKATQMNGPLRELYRREIVRDPEEAISGRCTGLLESLARPALLIDLVDWRWQAASRYKNLGGIVTDHLQALRERFERDDEESWVRLTLMAMHYLAWTPNHGLLEDCHRLIHEHEHVHTRLAEEFDRAEYLMELSTAWRMLLRDEEAPKPIIDLIPLSWTRSFGEYRPQVTEFLAAMARDPRSALRQLDRVRQVAPPVLAQFGNILMMYHQSLNTVEELNRSTERVAEQIERFLYRMFTPHYGQFRHAALDFCTGESVPVEALAEIAGRDRVFWISNELHLGDALAGDWPLRYTCLAIRLFWM